MTLRELYRHILHTLLNQVCSKRHEAEVEAEFILEHVTGKSKVERILQAECSASNYEIELVQDILRRRLEGCPLQYILGRAWFYGEVFNVSPAVLIPRPETELLVEKALQICMGLHKPRILEIGIGSGCVSICLAKHLPDAEIWATEISLASIEVAERNKLLHGIDCATRLRIYHCDLLADELLNRRFDLVLSNPPYVTEKQYGQLQPEIAFEPKEALVGIDNSDGLNYYRRIAESSLQYERILLETSPELIDGVNEIFIATDPTLRTEYLYDLNMKPRVLSGLHQEHFV